MRICTVTCNNAENYGARLQAYALRHYLKSLGHNVSVIDYVPKYETFGVKLWYNPRLSIVRWAKLFLRFQQRRLQISKHARLEAFSRKYLNLTDKYFSIEQLRDNPPIADAYIAGSDQIWNTSLANGTDPVYYLDFGPSTTRRISYAASFAIPAIPSEHRDFVRNSLQRFDAISVREASGTDIVRNLCDRNAQLVCDPVLLPGTDFWNEFASDDHSHDDYVLVYDFENNKALHHFAIDFAKRRRLKVYSVSPFKIHNIDKNFVDCTPETFVGLIKNAHHVICNSLHACLFSIIFQRDFLLYNRVDGLNERMTQLLSRYGLLSRVVSDDTMDVPPIDYALVDSLLNHDIQTSKQWIANELKG